MVGFGPGSEMMKAYNANRNKTGRGSKLKDIEKNYQSKHKKLQFNEGSEEKLEAFRRKFQEQQKRDAKKRIIIMTTTGVILVTAAIIILFSKV